MMWRQLICFLALILGCIGGPSLAGLRVSGNQLVNKYNQVVRLHGVDHSGTEYACVQGWGIFDGPSDASLLKPMLKWNINAIRVPLNEDCWLGINGVNPKYSSQNYINAITEYVTMMTQQFGFAVIVELHWSAPGSQLANGQSPMPDRDHSPAFWSSVAAQFMNNSQVIFDLFNEPYPDNNNWNSDAGWQCWLNGGSCSGVSFTAAGMQELVDAVRNTTATNVIMLGGLAYSNSLAQWLKYKPYDPLKNLAASWHSYNFNFCVTQSCWDQYVAPVAAAVPLITGELGENDCNSGYITPLLQWLDSHNANYLAWTWNTWDCNGGPSLISNYDGTPTNYGVGYKNHLQSFQ